uniref:Uncharacterized protein n=1 Tax=Picea sitchensis TaxID=3332 RepID=A0A6B9XS21_PICSI|nr:hypothetical protein Q903MT_gene3790 [Picea sitchensis]
MKPCPPFWVCKSLLSEHSSASIKHSGDGRGPPKPCWTRWGWPKRLSRMYVSTCSNTSGKLQFF